MAGELIGFPNEIEATLGSGWTGKHGLAPGASILQQKDASENRWTEDGGNTANDLTNRLRFIPNVYAYSMGTSYWSVMRNVTLAAADNDNWRNLGFWSVHDFLGGSPTGYALDYVFKDLWAGTAYGSAYDGRNYGFFNESWVPYNDQVFLALEEYDPNTPPADVIGFAGSSNAYDKAQLSWLEPLGAETYTIQRSPHGENDWTTLTSSATGIIQQHVALIEDSALRFPRLLGVTGAAVVVEHHEDLSFQCSVDEFTILFWVQTTVTSRGLLGKGRQSSGDYQILVRLDNSPVGTLEVRLGSSTITFNSSTTIHDGQPHAVAIRMRNEGGTQTASVWIDGVKDAESTSGIGSETNAHPWVLGGYWSPSNQQPESVMDGGLGLMAFFDRALDDAEIQSVGVTRNAEGV